MVSSDLPRKTLSAVSSCLITIDVQERLAPAVAGTDTVQAEIRKLLTAASQLSVPCVFTEQYPGGLGVTLPQVREAAGAGQVEVVEKITFSAMGEPAFPAFLERVARRQLLLCGMETHVCVLQTALDLKGRGHEVYVVADACGSRDPWQKETGLTRLRQEGVCVVSTEMVLFEWLERAGTESFRSLLGMIK